MGFVKATKSKSRARIGLCGPAGSGKTYTSLTIAKGLGEKIAVIDTEHGSASKYADEFEFDVMELDSFHPQNYINGIKEAETAGYEVLVIDSLSHAWMGKDGVIELKEKAEARQKGGNSFTAWKDVTPLHNALVEAILQCKLHVIVTMRSKMEYIIEKNDKGQSVPKKVGMAPVQRDGMEYEFDIVGDMDVDNTLIISKSRCKNLAGEVIKRPGIETANIIKDWLSDGITMINNDQINEIRDLAEQLVPLGVSKKDSFNLMQLEVGNFSKLEELSEDRASRAIKQLENLKAQHSQEQAAV